MKTYLPLCVFFLSIILFSRALLHGLLPIPSDTIVGLYYPFRDIYVATNPNGVPFKNFLITDPVRQQYLWRNLTISLEKSGQVPLWNPYNFSGYPLLANFQSAPLYPLNILFFIVPFKYSWSILVLLQPLFAGIFMYFFLRYHKISSVSSSFGAFVYAFSGFFIAWLEWNTVDHVVLWLPLVLLAKEHLLKKRSFLWVAILLFSEVSMFLAGHIQTLFYAIIISNTYLLVRIYQLAKQDKGKLVSNIIHRYVPFLIIGILVFAITAIQWVPGLQFILQSARDVDQVNNWQKDGWFIPWQHLVQFLVPDFFGNPTTLNYWGVWNYGEFIGYIGVVPLVIAIYALFARRDKKILYFGTLFFLSIIFALPTFFSKIPFILHIPFLSSSQPTRLLFITDFSLSILAALGLDILWQKRNVLIGTLIFFSFIFLGIWVAVIFNSALFRITPENLLVAQHNSILPSIYFVLGVVCIGLGFVVKPKRRQAIIVLLVLLSTVDLFRFAEKFTPFTPDSYLFPSTTSINFLKSHADNYRIMSIDESLFPPNFATQYKLQDISGYDPLYLLRYGEFIAAVERNAPNINPPFGFNRIITPHNYESQFINLLGVKYVLSLSELKNKNLKEVFVDRKTHVYENNNVFKRAFFVRSTPISHSKQETIHTMFILASVLQTVAIVEENGFHLSQTGWGIGTATINIYTPNKVLIKTINSEDGFLVFTDVYYPAWHAKIDGQETQIFITDYLFRGIVVPKGKHIVEFYNTYL